MTEAATTSPTTRARLNEQDRRGQLLAFGRHHFAEHGFSSMPMQEIAGRAGVSKGLLYHYFGGRRGFYLATVTDVIDGVIAAMRPADTSDPLTALRALVEGFVAYVVDNAAIYQALVGGGLGADPEVGEQLHRVRHFAIRAISERVGIAKLSTMQRIQLVGWVAWVEAATATWLNSRGVEREEFVTSVLATLQLALAQMMAASNGENQ